MDFIREDISVCQKCGTKLPSKRCFHSCVIVRSKKIAALQETAAKLLAKRIQIAEAFNSMLKSYNELKNGNTKKLEELEEEFAELNQENEMAILRQQKDAEKQKEHRKNKKAEAKLAQSQAMKPPQNPSFFPPTAGGPPSLFPPYPPPPGAMGYPGPPGGGFMPPPPGSHPMNPPFPVHGPSGAFPGPGGAFPGLGGAPPSSSVFNQAPGPAPIGVNSSTSFYKHQEAYHHEPPHPQVQDVLPPHLDPNFQFHKKSGPPPPDPKQYDDVDLWSSLADRAQDSKPRKKEKRAYKGRAEAAQDQYEQFAEGPPDAKGGKHTLRNKLSQFAFHEKITELLKQPQKQKIDFIVNSVCGALDQDFHRGKIIGVYLECNMKRMMMMEIQEDLEDIIVSNKILGSVGRSMDGINMVCYWLARRNDLKKILKKYSIFDSYRDNWKIDEHSREKDINNSMWHYWGQKVKTKEYSRYKLILL